LEYAKIDRIKLEGDEMDWGFFIARNLSIYNK